MKTRAASASIISETESSANLLLGKTGRPGLPLGRRLSRTGLWFALPAILFVGLFFVIPQVLNLRFAFSNWTTYSSEIKFNGLDNFASLRGVARNL